MSEPVVEASPREEREIVIGVRMRWRIEVLIDDGSARGRVTSEADGATRGR